MSNLPLFWCLSVESQAALMQYHWDNFGTTLELPSRPEPGFDKDIISTESLDEIDKLIRQAPSKSRE